MSKKDLKTARYFTLTTNYNSNSAQNILGNYYYQGESIVNIYNL